mmetsp:Transcript_24945/g.68763  ORF Transcript_24945/g.68763 Transcript_24945/m.68763 type:complete len:645 (+) Transcript_24945:146-2080(+)
MEVNIEEELEPNVYASDKDQSAEDSVDHESLLLNELSLLSNLGDVASCFKPITLDRKVRNNCDEDCGIVDWIFRKIVKEWPSPTYNESNNGDEIIHEKSSLYSEWSKSLQNIQGLIPHIAPFELHIIASQSILFCEESTTSHRILCLLLCTNALQQCPLSLKKRWKRWQSLVCETLRMFQDSIPLLDSDNLKEDSCEFVVSLMIRHIVPACLHVIDQLPTEISYHVAIFSALVGTSCNVLERGMSQCQKELSGGANEIASVISTFEESSSTIYHAVQSIRLSFERFGLVSETTPWRDMEINSSLRKENRNEDVDFLMHRDNLSWWAAYRKDEYEPEERIANMDTSVNEVGLALLAMKAFEDRPMVYHPKFVWRVWLSHVIVLLGISGVYPIILEQSTSFFLESLVLMVPESFLQAEKLVCQKPNAPVEVLLALSKRLVSKVEKGEKDQAETKKGEKKVTSPSNKEAEFKMRSQRTVSLIKAFLGRFATVSQVQIVTKLVKNCSIPGLQARFLDLLRPVILIPDCQAEKLLWELIVMILNDLFKKYWNKNEKNLVDIDILINRDVEISVGAITMIQMWSMVEGKEFPVDKKRIEDDLRGFDAALKKLLRRWAEEPSLSPKLHYRLFLLDNAIDSTLCVLNTGEDS